MSMEETRYRYGRLEARQIPDWEPLNTEPFFCTLPDDEETTRGARADRHRRGIATAADGAVS